MVLLWSGGREYHQMNIIVEACRDRCNMIVVDVDIIAERSETVVLSEIPHCRPQIDVVKIVDCHVRHIR